MVANPGLALAIAADQRGLASPQPLSWAQTVSMLQHLWNLTEAHVAPSHRHGRLKQWLNLLRRSQPEAQAAFDALRPLTKPEAVDQWLAVQLSEQNFAPAMAPA
jgi:tRNA-dihydrouridine synthase C